MTTKESNVVALPASDAHPYLAMATKALEQGNVDLVDRMMELHKRWEAHEAEKAFNAALAAAKAEFTPILKNRTMEFGAGRKGYRYEDFAAVSDAINPALAKHGVLFWHEVETLDDGRTKVVCVLEGHGHQRKSPPMISPPDTSGSKNAIQAMGSVQTYLQRYTLKAMLGLAVGVDDDANSVSKALSQETLTDKEIEVVTNLITETKADINKVLDRVGVPSISDIPRTYYGTVIKKLELRKKEAKK